MAHFGMSVEELAGEAGISIGKNTLHPLISGGAIPANHYGRTVRIDPAVFRRHQAILAILGIDSCDIDAVKAFMQTDQYLDWMRSQPL